MLKVALRASGKRLTPYVSFFHTDGQSQKNFTERFGHSNGACVARSVRKGMTIGQIHQAVKDCAKGRGKA